MGAGRVLTGNPGAAVGAGELAFEPLEQLEFVHRTAGLTSWIWEVASDRVQWFGDPDALLGLPPGGFSGRFDDYLARLHPEDAGAAKRTYVDCLKGRLSAWRSEERLLQPDGSVRWLETFGRAEQAGERVVRMAGVVRDITGRRAAEQRVRELNERLEERVRARTRALEVANRDLDGFSLAVSHDLRAPACTLANFATLLEAECSAALGDAGRNYVRRMRAIAMRMGEMIDGLLELSRAGRAPLASATVPLERIAAEVAEELRPACRFRGHVAIAPLHEARGDGRLLRQVLQNLLANAMKFSRDGASPRVEVSSRRLPDGRAEYCVRDNGVGFDMRQSERLFGTFQRLHADERYEGTGVGLATVRRIVERHGGTVAYQARQEGGARFVVKLPLGGGHA